MSTYPTEPVSRAPAPAGDAVVDRRPPPFPACVSQCDAEDCANNHRGRCLEPAVAVTVEGLCDAFRPGAKRQEQPRRLPVVAGCGLADCRFNRGGCCRRDHVRIGADWGVCCLMFEPA